MEEFRCNKWKGCGVECMYREWQPNVRHFDPGGDYLCDRKSGVGRVQVILRDAVDEANEILNTERR